MMLAAPPLPAAATGFGGLRHAHLAPKTPRTAVTFAGTDQAAPAHAGGMSITVGGVAVSLSTVEQVAGIKVASQTSAVTLSFDGFVGTICLRPPCEDRSEDSPVRKRKRCDSPVVPPSLSGTAGPREREGQDAVGPVECSAGVAPVLAAATLASARRAPPPALVKSRQSPREGKRAGAPARTGSLRLPPATAAHIVDRGSTPGALEKADAPPADAAEPAVEGGTAAPKDDADMCESTQLAQRDPDDELQSEEDEDFSPPLAQPSTQSQLSSQFSQRHSPPLPAEQPHATALEDGGGHADTRRVAPRRARLVHEDEKLAKRLQEEEERTAEKEKRARNAKPKWIKVSSQGDLPCARWGHSSTLVKTKPPTLLLTGGDAVDTQGRVVTLPDAYEYDGGANRWARLDDDSAVARSFHTAAVVDQTGGADGQGQKMLVVFGGEVNTPGHKEVLAELRILCLQDRIWFNLSISALYARIYFCRASARMCGMHRERACMYLRTYSCVSTQVQPTSNGAGAASAIRALVRAARGPLHLLRRRQGRRLPQRRPRPRRQKLELVCAAHHRHPAERSGVSCRCRVPRVARRGRRPVHARHRRRHGLVGGGGRPPPGLGNVGVAQGVSGGAAPLAALVRAQRRSPGVEHPRCQPGQAGGGGRGCRGGRADGGGPRRVGQQGQVQGRWAGGAD